MARTLLLIIFFLAVISLVFTIGSSQARNGGLVALILALTVWIIAERIDRKVDAHFRKAKWADQGAQAEEEVARILAGMASDDFLSIGDIECPFGNIDHVVISRTGGVFAIETKSSKGRIDSQGDLLLLNGVPIDRNPIEQVLREAMWVKDQIGGTIGLRPYVKAVVLFTRAFVNVRGPIRGVEVSTLRYLERLITTTRPSATQSEDLWRHRQEIADALTRGSESPA